jgi:hypothetical protein
VSADVFKQQLGDSRISDLLDLINAQTPTEVILFEVAKEADTRKVTQRIAELMYTVLLRELGYSEDFDIAELEIELEAEGKLPEFIATCKTLLNKDGKPCGPGAQKLSRECHFHQLDPKPILGGFVVHSQRNRDASISVSKWNARSTSGVAAARVRLSSSSSTKWASTLLEAATRSKTCGRHRRIRQGRQELAQGS